MEPSGSTRNGASWLNLKEMTLLERIDVGGMTNIRTDLKQISLYSYDIRLWMHVIGEAL